MRGDAAWVMGTESGCKGLQISNKCFECYSMAKFAMISLLTFVCRYVLTVKKGFHESGSMV